MLLLLSAYFLGGYGMMEKLKLRIIFMSVIPKIGDLFSSSQPVLAQGVNVFGVMGAGIAVIFKQRSEEMFLSYAEACRSGELQAGGLHVFQEPEGTWIFNLASQDKPGKYARLEWFESSLRKAASVAVSQNLSGIALPRIGAGIGGLNWDDCLTIVNQVALENPTVDFEVWTHPKDL